MIGKGIISEVESGPEIEKSMSCDEINKSLYTVIGNYKEFGPPIVYTEPNELPTES